MPKALRSISLAEVADSIDDPQPLPWSIPGGMPGSVPQGEASAPIPREPTAWLPGAPRMAEVHTVLASPYNEPYPRHLRTAVPNSPKVDLYQQIRVSRDDRGPWEATLRQLAPFLLKRRDEPMVDRSFMWRDYTPPTPYGVA